MQDSEAARIVPKSRNVPECATVRNATAPGRDPPSRPPEGAGARLRLLRRDDGHHLLPVLVAKVDRAVLPQCERTRAVQQGRRSFHALPADNAAPGERLDIALRRHVPDAPVTEVGDVDAAG